MVWPEEPPKNRSEIESLSCRARARTICAFQQNPPPAGVLFREEWDVFRPRRDHPAALGADCHSPREWRRDLCRSLQALICRLESPLLYRSVSLSFLSGVDEVVPSVAVQNL